jgi:hypothetical protein
MWSLFNPADEIAVLSSFMARLRPSVTQRMRIGAAD